MHTHTHTYLEPFDPVHEQRGIRLMHAEARTLRMGRRARRWRRAHGAALRRARGAPAAVRPLPLAA